MHCAAAAAIAVSVLVVVAGPFAHAGPAGASGSFTKEQAARGKTLYDTTCAPCHGSALVADEATATDLTGLTFRLAWQGQTVANRFESIRAGMPPGRPQMLTDQEYLDIVTYVLSFNSYPAGSDELKPDLERLRTLVIEPLPGAAPGH